jgi:seryl-tRNA synthetase
MADNFEEGLIQRIEECQLVVDRLDNDPAWKVILRDLEILKKQIDDSWQAIDDDKKLERARVMKFAVQHLIDIKTGYETELKAAKEELTKIQNPDKEIQKDYDKS